MVPRWKKILLLEMTTKSRFPHGIGPKQRIHQNRSRQIIVNSPKEPKILPPRASVAMVIFGHGASAAYSLSRGHSLSRQSITLRRLIPAGRFLRNGGKS